MRRVESASGALRFAWASPRRVRTLFYLCILLLWVAPTRAVAMQDPGDTQSEATSPRSADASESPERDGVAAAETETTSAASDEEEGGPDELKVFWKDTLRIETADKNFRLKLGGRFQGDWAVFDTRDNIEEEVGDFMEGTEVRRARLYYSGTLFKHFEFKTQIELTDRNIEAKDVYIGLVDMPVIGNLRVGHFKEPFGLNELTSSKYIMFMERSLTTATFAPGRNTGIMLHNTALDERMTWAVGFFRETDEFFNGDVSDGLHLTGRVTALPWYEEDGSKLLHVGVAWSHQRPGGDLVGYDARPESHIAPKLADTDDIVADRVDLLGAEVALVLGSFSVQGEYIHAFVNQAVGGGVQFHSFYVEASYIFTGEHRSYETDVAEFGRIRPKRNVGEEGGLGAWEAALRYSYLDLTQAEVRGGRLSDLTFGLNWYLNPNTRISWNYVYADAQDSGYANVFQMRLQFAF